MRGTDTKIRRWLRAEAAASAVDEGREAAESALASLLVALPVLRPRAGFAGRVLQRARLVAPPRRQDLFETTPVRWGVAACLALAALSLLLIPRLLWGSLVEAGWGGLVQLPVDAVLKVTELVGDSFAMWETFAHVGRILSALVAQPAVSASLLGILLLTAVVFRLLQNLIASDRSWSYVES